jgi:hypothetical protein
MSDEEADDSESRSWYEWVFDAILELLSLF